MATIKFHKVLVLPGTLEADSLYFVSNSTYSETYLTDSAGVAKSIGNSAMIAAVANTEISTRLAQHNLVEIVADITARNLLATQDRNLVVMVLDATGDATVAAGAALYAFRNSDNSWTKVAEYEGMDAVVQWSNINGRPTSSVAQIDSAVTNSHTHSNKAVLDGTQESFTTILKTTYDAAVTASHGHGNKATLDKLSDAGGVLSLDGVPVTASWATQNW